MRLPYKKILIVVPQYSSFYKPYCEAFMKMGINFQLFDNRKSVVLEKFVFLCSILHKPFYTLGLKMINLRLINAVKFYKPDLVLVIKGENIMPETVLEIRNTTPIINYFSDYFRWFKDETIKSWVSAYQAIFTGDNYDVDTYRKKGYKNIYYLPMAGPKLTYSSKLKKYDVVFVGAYSTKREETFKALTEFNLKIWGDKGWAGSSLKDYYMGKWLSADGTLEVFKNSKIVINFHNDLTGKNRYINLRVFEATAAGAFLISDSKMDLPTLFKVGQEIIVYKSREDLRKKICYFLDNPRERKEIAKRGHERCLKDHIYENRLRKMFDILDRV